MCQPTHAIMTCVVFCHAPPSLHPATSSASSRDSGGIKHLALCAEKFAELMRIMTGLSSTDMSHSFPLAILFLRQLPQGFSANWIVGPGVNTTANAYNMETRTKMIITYIIKCILHAIYILLTLIFSFILLTSLERLNRANF